MNQYKEALKAMVKVYLSLFGFYFKVILITGMGIIMILSILKLAGF